MNAPTAGAGQLELLPPLQDRAQPLLVRAEVVEHRHVADRYWFLRLHGPRIAASARPGQFVMLTVARNPAEGPVLPRPMAVYATDPAAGTFDIMYGIVGPGTRQLTSFAVTSTILVVGPLGRSFVVNPQTRRVLLVGRGIGTCSLTMLAVEAGRAGIEVTALDSARTAHALVADSAYQDAGVSRLIQVLDSDGTSDPLSVRHILESTLRSDPPQQIFTCGSSRLAELSSDLGGHWGAEVQVSLEAHMACGLGYCHGCASGQRVAAAESPLICTDGPVFRLVRGGPET